MDDTSLADLHRAVPAAQEWDCRDDLEREALIRLIAPETASEGVPPAELDDAPPLDWFGALAVLHQHLGVDVG